MKMLKVTAMGVCALILSSAWSEAADPEQRPNIIYIFTDQQSATMMSCAGNQYLKTPAMDYIAKNGVRFERAYTTNPVCSPARVSLMTGRFPGYFKDRRGRIPRSNKQSMSIPKVSDEVKKTTLAAFLKEAGYKLAYGGKEHLPKPLTPGALGFEKVTDDERDELAIECAKFIKQKHDKPYFLVASFINPHDICYMALDGLTFDNPTYPAGANLKPAQQKLAEAIRLPDGVSEEEFFDKYCPPLPPNFEPQLDEPKAINKFLKDSRSKSFRMRARMNYTDKDWRLHRWAYHRLTEVVDAQIQQVLDALKESGQEENTLIIFSSDHGEMSASHRTEHKSLLYEESARIPFIAMWKGQIPAGVVDTEHLISNGLDLLPTICDYAGIKGVSDPRGLSLRPLLEGKETPWRTTLGVESEVGRMVVSQNKLKYLRYDYAGIEEQLLDLNKDPFETRHFTDNPEYAVRLDKLRASFKAQWFPDIK
jgi:choline-sulfatase